MTTLSERNTAQRAGDDALRRKRPAWAHRQPVKMICLSLVLALLTILPAYYAVSGFTPGNGENEHNYLPAIFSPGTDLFITGLEVTQATQTAANSVPLVEARPTIVRVYAEATMPVGDVPASLSAFRSGNLIGTVVTEPMTVTESASRGIYQSSFNITLPGSWLAGEVVLVAEVDPADTINEQDESNNVAELDLHFNAMPPMDVKLIPINYTHTPTGDFYPSYPTDTDALHGYLMKIFPMSDVALSYRAPVDFAGNLSDGGEWIRLLSTILAVKNADGAPASQFYYGLIPTTNANGDNYPRAYGGYGYYFTRAAIGTVESGPWLAAHELGHNFGRRHAPCGNPPDVDPAYPYPNGSIGQYGLDVVDERLWTPGPPDNAADIMSYCQGWISDYTYLAVYQDQLNSGVAPTIADDALLIRVKLPADGAPEIQPVYRLSGTRIGPSAASRYEIVLINAEGVVLATYPVAVLVAGEDELALEINSVVPFPAESSAQIQLLEDGRVIAARPLRSAGQPLVVAREEGNNSLSWDPAHLPALVRYTVDDGLSWLTLGLDVVGGRLSFDDEKLPAGAGWFEVGVGQ